MVIVFLIILFFSFNIPALSQDAPPVSQQDFSYQLDIYNQSFLNYLEKKNIHSNYGSLATSKELLDSIKTSLNQRNNLTNTYINLIINNLESNKTQDIENTTNIINNLSQDKAWLASQSNLIQSISTQTDLDIFNQQFIESFKKVKYNIASGRSQHLINHQIQVINNLDSFLSQIEATAKLDNPSKNWFIDIRSQIQNSSNILAEVSQTVKSSNISEYRNFSDFYPDVKRELDRSSQNLFSVIENIESFYKKFF